ncbi:SNF2 family N-terminal domain-containing protein [Cercophora newfieldiana]|uniref:SNF2 family N-terminal domain-containing protein n=1 Tax=Cercophora newfieldiana TaxID=92897 RepID=A0AA39Y0S0_9PEZI|nr:SNF2 family N-terminal domain-containing protein [Cercophora newfieldiana]
MESSLGDKAEDSPIEIAPDDSANLRALLSPNETPPIVKLEPTSDVPMTGLDTLSPRSAPDSDNTLPRVEDEVVLSKEHRSETGNKLDKHDFSSNHTQHTPPEASTNVVACQADDPRQAASGAPVAERQIEDSGDSLKLVAIVPNHHPGAQVEENSTIRDLQENPYESDEDSLFVSNPARQPSIKIKQEAESDSDSDICEIDARDIPAKTMAILSAHKFGTHADQDAPVVCTGTRVKREPEERAILDSIRRGEEEDRRAGSDFEMDDQAQLSDGSDDERPRPSGRRPAWVQKQQEKLQSAPPVPGTSESMETEEGPEDHQDAAETEEHPEKELKDLETNLKILKLQRTLSFQSEIQRIEIDVKIEEHEKKIQSLKKRPARPKNAREFWERKYEKTQRFMPGFSPKKRPAPVHAVPGSSKKGKTNSGKAAAVADNSRGKLLAAIGAHNLKADLAANGEIPPAGAFVRNNKTHLFAQIKTFEKMLSGGLDARDDLKKLEFSSSSFGFKKCSLEKGADIAPEDMAKARFALKGIKTTLYPHQVVGTSWMVGRELSPHGPYGGIQGDAMGLGKTLMILACMRHNPPTKQDIAAGRITTLIVVPKSSLTQWEAEISKHIPEGAFKEPHIYKRRDNVKYKLWSTSDIVLTTYAEVSRSHPTAEVRDRIDEMEVSEEKKIEEYQKRLGDLYRVQFYRVVLDEAHVIKNKESQLSEACCELSSKYRWAVTGTPIHNGLNEMFPFFKFIGVECSKDFRVYEQLFGKVAEKDHRQRLQAMAAHVMIRRKIDDKFLGQPILDIPEPYPIVDHWVDQSEEERLIYRHAETLFRTAINKHMKSKKNNKEQYLNMFALGTYLRQGTSHLFLFDSMFRNYWKASDFDKIIRQLRAFGMRDDSVLLKQLKTYRRPGNARPPPVTRRLAKLTRDRGYEGAICRICSQLPEDPHISPKCRHAFCLECFEVEIENALYTKGLEYVQCPSLGCGEKIRRVVPLRSQRDKKTKSSPATNNLPTLNKVQGDVERGYGDDLHGIQPMAAKSQLKNGFLERCDEQQFDNGNWGGIPSSTKMDAVMGFIEQWTREAPDDKIIVFTHWVNFAKILGRSLYEQGTGFLYHFGSMSQSERDSAVFAFHENNDAKILIASDQTGSVSLNLACANRVISVDCWWNKSMEKQAFGRVRRIGQTKRPLFVRILQRNTIDKRIVHLQERKEIECNIVMEGDNVEKTKDLTIEQVVGLFGSVRELPGGGMEVVADYDDLQTGENQAEDNEDDMDHSSDEDDAHDEMGRRGPSSSDGSRGGLSAVDDNGSGSEMLTDESEGENFGDDDFPDIFLQGYGEGSGTV